MQNVKSFFDEKVILNKLWQLLSSTIKVIRIYLPWKVKPGEYTLKKTSKNDLKPIYLFASKWSSCSNWEVFLAFIQSSTVDEIYSIISKIKYIN